MQTKTAVNRAKAFLNNFIGEMYDWDIDIEGSEDYDMSYNDEPYYIYFDVENHGCFTTEGKFCTEQQVNQLIEMQLSCSSKEAFDRWDNIIIFDVEENKVVVPRIRL